MELLYKTDRLFVRKFEYKDANDLFEYISSEEIMKFLPYPVCKNMEEINLELKRVIDEYESGVETCDYAIALQESNKVIGTIGIVEYDRDVGGIMEIIYLLNPSFQGKGYMTEALKGMFKYVKQRQLATRIELRHDSDNQASGAVMRRAGMTFEGILRKAECNNCKKRADMALYSILAEEIE